MVLKPGMGLAVSVQARENPTGPLIGPGAGPVDLKFVSPITKVRLKYRCFTTISWNIIPDLVGGSGILVYFLVILVDFLVVIVEF